ncbi:uncharacterized protein FIBRA_07237 [Fibroporia radiculosa]|uniref:Sterol regulatory element-binding protein cleavage-activating protein n=1 Tax=Fibroporia radiculosa TaxID=599839 RepID=J4GUK2_9APHY|nr:uncharacterized protein FIBRA_07237 [Fibroporia radiculosa]CCM05035.1 predicted protein [Fibroporia radiculosa]
MLARAVSRPWSPQGLSALSAKDEGNQALPRLHPHPRPRHLSTQPADFLPCPVVSFISGTPAITRSGGDSAHSPLFLRRTSLTFRRPVRSEKLCTPFRPLQSFRERPHYSRRLSHCATHQIRLILVSSIVITSLLFPAIAVYTSPETHFFAGFTLRVLDSFVASDDLSNYFVQNDLRHLWEGHSTLRVREDSVARVQCGMQGILRSERVMVGSLSSEYGLEALERNTLISALDLERRISNIISRRRIPCVKTPAGSCFSLSPLAFWNHDQHAILADDNILDTVNLAHNISVSGVPISPDMVLAGREHRDPTSSSYIDSAMFLVLTYLFPDRDCLGNVGHFEWLRVLKEAAGYSADFVVQTQAPKLVALEYDKDVSMKGDLSILSVFCYAAYLVFFVYAFHSMRRMDTVHSRFGLAVTGMVELIVSTITSLSVCALVGFRMTMVPWELFPIIVIFIGVENMFHIVDAVLKTSVTIPVKERIAQGLGQAGTSNTLKVVSYNTVLGVIAFFSSGAIRQFCAFSIVVLVAHWFLVHTFFVTVLSIDIQRLELDELLRQDSLAPSESPKASPMRTLPPPKTWSQALTAAKNTIRGRPAKNLSLFLVRLAFECEVPPTDHAPFKLLAITATLYFATSPSSVSLKDDTRASLTHNSLRQFQKVTATDRVSPAFRAWQVLSPNDDTLVHVRIESPSIIMLAPGDDAQTDQQELRAESERALRPRVSRVSRLWTRMARQVWWLIKIIIVPITATTMALYALLLYLLKNVELLEANRQRPEEESQSADESCVEDEIAFTTLPRASPTDVEVIATSKDGKVVAGLGLQNEFVIWRTDTTAFTTVDTSDILLSSASTASVATTLTALAINEVGSICAVGTGTGVIGIWSVGKDDVKPFTQLYLDNTCAAAVTQLHFGYAHSRPPSPVRPPTPSPPATEHAHLEDMLSLYATYDNGMVVRWEVQASPRARYITPSRSASVVKSMLLPVNGDERLLVGFSLEDGTFELCDVDQRDKMVARECWIAAGNPQDLVCKVDVCNAELDGRRHVIIAAATRAGVVSLWAAAKRECLFILDEPFGDIGHLRLTPVHMSTCSTCGELPCENFLVSFSVGQLILIHRAYLHLPTRRCSCPRSQPLPTLRASVLGHRSRSGSAASLASSNGSATPRSRGPSFSSTSSGLDTFPVSAHGVHSRRASEKESHRRSHDMFFLNSDCDDADGHPVGPIDVSPAAGFLSSHPPTSIWQSLVVMRIADAMAERGSWDVMGDKIVGIRRRPRPPFVKGRADHKVQLKVESPRGLSASTLERWELWTFDPEESRLQASSLIVLNRDVDDRLSLKRKRDNAAAEPSASAQAPRRAGVGVIPRLHFTRVAPLVSGPRFCLAGFGNTVGVLDFSGRAIAYSLSFDINLDSEVRASDVSPCISSFAHFYLHRYIPGRGGFFPLRTLIHQKQPMRLYLVHNDPERMTLVSAEGVAHYQVTTSKSHTFGGPAVSRIRRPAQTESESLVAEIEWRRLWGAHPIVRSRVFDGSDQELLVKELLYKVGNKFSLTRYFLGNDDEVYRWKAVKGIGSLLTNDKTGEEVARFSQDFVEDGFFRGEKKWFLQIQLTSLSVDMIVITFMIMEKKRRDRVADHQAVRVLDHDEDLADGGGIEA